MNFYWIDSIIDLANSYVPVTKVLSWYNIFVPDVQPGRSWKTVCPFGEIYHFGRGIDKTMRVYSDTNSAFCFDGCGYLTPVAIYSKLQNLTFLEAAEDLLDRQGFKARSQDDIWEELTSHENVVDRESLAEALKQYCSNVFGSYWKMAQFEQPYSNTLDRCLNLLNLVKSPEEAELWLTRTKLVMRELKS